jgi:hypothetical protein
MDKDSGEDGDFDVVFALRKQKSRLIEQIVGGSLSSA